MWSDSKREEDFRVNFECTSYIFSSGLRESRDWLSTSQPAMTDSPDLLYSPYMCVCVCLHCKGVHILGDEYVDALVQIALTENCSPKNAHK